MFGVRDGEQIYAVAVQGGLSQGEGGSPHGWTRYPFSLGSTAPPSPSWADVTTSFAPPSTPSELCVGYISNGIVNAAAGIFLAVAVHLSPNGFRTVIDIDAVGTFMMCRKALKYLKKGGPGKEPSCDGIIMNVSATLHYTTTWLSLTASPGAWHWHGERTMGSENGIAPGPINDTTGASKLGPDDLMTEMQQMPLFKLGDKWDITIAAVYLASDAGKFISGNKLVVHCGQWLSSPRHLAKDAIRQLSREAERRPRDSLVGLPRTK